MSQNFQDINLVCADREHPEGLERDFVFTVGEQAYYSSNGLTQPRRCPDCRERRKRAKEAQQ